MRERFVPAENKLVIVPLQSDIKAEADGKVNTIYEFYRLGGASDAKKAITAATGIEIDRYMKFSKDSFTLFSNFMGNVDYEVPYNLVYENETTGESTIIKSGRQTLDSGTLRKVLTFPNFKGGEEYRAKVVGTITVDLINSGASGMLRDGLDSVFTSVINSDLETDITKYDYDEAKPAIEYVLDATSTPAQVGIPAPESRLKQYPFEFSGGMRQRIIIAIALACNPKLIVADEPTTALDVTVQAQILDLLRKITEESDAGVIIITHDLGVVASLCDRISIMYGGNIMEEGTTDEIFYDPKHPYTKGLLNSIANSNADHREPLKPIPGTPPDLLKLGDQCPFASRCSEAMEICTKATPLVTEFGETHKCKCWLHCKERWQEVMKGEDAHE